MAEKEFTICYNCMNFLNLDPNSARKDVWYNHLCTANRLPRKINPIKGKKEFYEINNLGNECFSDKEFKYCRDCNNGKCKDFKPIANLKLVH